MNTKNPAYNCWKKMRDRCNNKANTNFRYYGGKGIKVCQRWDSFANFIADMGERPSMAHSIERVDADGNYSPRNCRWATVAEQAMNRSRKVWAVQDGQPIRAIDIAKAAGLDRATVYARIRGGWPFEKLSLPTSKSRHTARQLTNNEIISLFNNDIEQVSVQGSRSLSGTNAGAEI